MPVAIRKGSIPFPAPQALRACRTEGTHGRSSHRRPRADARDFDFDSRASGSRSIHCRIVRRVAVAAPDADAPLDRHSANRRVCWARGSAGVQRHRGEQARLSGTSPAAVRVEILVERILGPCRRWRWSAPVTGPASGSAFMFAGGVEAVVEGRRDDFFVLRFQLRCVAVLERQGHVPLPPYIAHADSAADLERYQTVYAARPEPLRPDGRPGTSHRGLLDARRAKGVAFDLSDAARRCRYVPASPQHPTVRTSHAQRVYEIPGCYSTGVHAARHDGRRVVAVGTTSLRALESAARESGEVKPGAAETACSSRRASDFVCRSPDHEFPAAEIDAS